MNDRLQEMLSGQLPGQADSYNTLRAYANDQKPCLARNPYLTASEIHDLDEPRKKFIYGVTKTFRNGGTVGRVSDGYHTFDELYHHRALLFATICNLHPELAWKSKQHSDPDTPMYDGMFICGIQTPLGQATYHYDLEPYWNMFHVPELPAAPPYDGHTPDEAIDRIFQWGCHMMSSGGGFGG